MYIEEQGREEGEGRLRISNRWQAPPVNKLYSNRNSGQDGEKIFKGDNILITVNVIDLRHIHIL